MAQLEDNKTIDLELLFCGDKKEWEHFVKEFSPSVWAAIRKAFRIYFFPYRLEDAEDVFCSVFHSLVEDNYKKLRRFHELQACSLITFLNVIAVRKSIDFMRKEKRRIVEASCAENGHTDILDMVTDSRPHAEDILREKERDHHFRLALDRLSPEYKEFYRLICDEGLSPEETADRLQLSINAVYVKKCRLIEKIKKHMKEIEGSRVYDDKT